MSPEQDLQLTSVGLFVCVVLGIGAWLARGGNKPVDRIRTYRMPWTFISLFSIAFGFMLLVHLVNLLGIETGRR